MNKSKSVIKELPIIFLRLYQHSISHFLPNSCRFTPSCSEYAICALKSYGILKGSWLTVKRICKCNPFHSGGYDPVR